MSRKRGLNDSTEPPERWRHCPRKSFTLIGDKFLAFKTPLDSRYDDSVGDEFLFHPSMAFSSAKGMHLSVGLWVDLTNTKRYYDQKLIEQHGCTYVKLACRGRGETPDMQSVNTFVKICSQFISQMPTKVIAVHCTHGFNRTGFMIVSYLVQAMDWSVEAAVCEFTRARPPGIYKEEYIHELFRLYGDIEDAPPAPALPMWHCEADDGPGEGPELADGGGDDDDQAGASGGPSSSKKRRSEQVQVKAVFMEGIPNVKPLTDLDLTVEIQHRIKQLTGFNSNGFPGCQPVSMDRENISHLGRPYMVSWKADGTRYLMYIRGAHEVFFIDRDNAVFQLEGVTFVSSRDRSRHLVDTLLDGEMVIDKDDKGIEYPRYLIYDLISLEGNQAMRENFSTRYRIIQKEIIDPRVEAMKERRIHREREPISIRRKEFWPLETTAYLLGDKFKAKLTHEPDGLIFQPIDDSYTAGTAPNVLKWKPPSHNSVDFRLKIYTESRPGMLKERKGQLFVGGLDAPFAEMKAPKSLAALDGKIIECRFENNKWVFMRQRTDKSFPNSYKTAQAVWQSIVAPVTNDILLDFVDQVKGTSRPVMPPPARPPPIRRPC